MMKREKPPVPMVRKERHGYSPVSAYDAELLFSDATGTEYDLVKRTKRSLPQLRLYWAMLGRVVKATGKWPTPEHLQTPMFARIAAYKPDFETPRIPE